MNTPLQIGNRTVQNRILFEPMEGCDGTPDGGFSALTRRRYMRLAEGGAGILWLEAVAVCPEGRANPRQLWIHEGNVAEYKELADAVRMRAKELYGFAPLLVIQLTHSGRQSRPVDIPRPIIAGYNDFLGKNKPLVNETLADTAYCEQVEEQFVRGAHLAVQAGFDAVDVKCCHGYLFNEFLAAYDRTDRFGGAPLENRARLYLETFQKVQAAVGGDILVTTRFGAYDAYPHPYGFGSAAEGNTYDMTEPFAVIEKLLSMGLGFLNLTVGNPYLNPHVNRPYRTDVEDGMVGIQRVREITTAIQKRFPALPVVLCAPTYLKEQSLDYAAEMIAAGNAQVVGFGRMTFAYPSFYQDYLKDGALAKNKCCTVCAKCSQMMRAGGVAGCPVRDTETYLPLYKKYCGEN